MKLARKFIYVFTTVFSLSLLNSCSDVIVDLNNLTTKKAIDIYLEDLTEGEYTIYENGVIPDGFTFDHDEKDEQGEVIAMYYKRKTITVTFKLGRDSLENANPNATWTDDTYEDKQISGRFGTSIEIPVTKANSSRYLFSGWNAAGNTEGFTFQTDGFTYVALWLDVDDSAEYKVYYYCQTVDLGNNYSLDYVSDIKIGQNNTQTNEESNVPEKTGFVLAHVDEANLVKGTVSTVKVYYNRKSVSITIDPNGGKWKNGPKKDTSEKLVIQGNYGVPFSYTYTITKEMYEFNVWEYQSAPLAALPTTFENDMEIKATWTQVEAPYKVRFLFEKANSNDYEQKSDYQDMNLVGTIGQSYGYSNPPAPPAGFQNGTVTNATVLADGSAVVQVKYSRKRVTLLWKLNTSANPEAKWSNGTTTDWSSTGKYGATVTDKPTNPTDTAHYAFTGWSPSVPTTYPLDGATYTAQWNRTKYDYSVEYYLDSVKMTPQTGWKVSGQGNVNSQVTVVKDVDFTVPTGTVLNNIVPVTLNPENQPLIVKVYFDTIVTYTFTYNANGGNWSGIISQTQTGNSGDTVPLMTPPTRTGWTFTGWSPTVPSTFDGNKTFTAQWIADYSSQTGTGNILPDDISIINTDGTLSIGGIPSGITGITYVWRDITAGTNLGTNSTLSISSLSNGKHDIVAKVTINGIVYSAQTTITIK